MNQKGFVQVPILIAIIAGLVLAGGVAYFGVEKYKSRQVTEESNRNQGTPQVEEINYASPKPEETKKQSSEVLTIPTQETKQESKPSTTADKPMSSASVIWSSKDFKWYPSGTPPECPEPLRLQTPVDMSLVTAALWPGQARGGYKAHGGFRFNSDGTNSIVVYAPIGGHLIQASQYLEGGEKQYFFIFSVPCGFIYRLDHLVVLSSKLAEAVKNLPPPTEGDSRTSYVNPPVWVDAGEIVATSIGVTKNIFFDFGLYDVRKPNNVVPNSAWADLYAADKEFGQYGICFFDYLSGNDGAIMRSLPTGKEGKVSDYCK